MDSEDIKSSVEHVEEFDADKFVRNEKLERSIRTKTDFRVMPVLAFLYLWCFIDRANIGNAKLAGFEKDLGLRGYDYNILASTFYIAYTFFEIPMTLLCKKIGPAIFIPASTVGFGLFAMLTGFVKSFGPAIVVRFLLGISEGAVLPGIAYYLTRFYRKDELTFRLSLYIVSTPLAGAFGGLLASGILRLDGFGMVRTWRLIFVIEGIITIGVGLIAFFLMVDSPSKARWLTDEEKKYAADRIMSENVGSKTVVEKMNFKAVLAGLLAPTTVVTAFIFLFDNVTVQGMGFFLPSIIRSIYPDKTVIQQQLFTVPPYVVGAACLLISCYGSWKLNKRLAFMIGSAPFIMLGYALFVGTTIAKARYAATFLIAAGAFSFGPYCNALVSANATTDSMRAGAISFNAMLGNLGGLISTWSYLNKHAPNYLPGNAMNLTTSSLMFILSCGLLAWHTYENKKRDRAALNRTEPQVEYGEGFEALGRKHPDFRYVN